MAKDITASHAGFDPARLDHARALLQEYVNGGVLPGVAAMIWRHGEPVAAWYLGQADLSTGRAVTAETLFPLASVTKPMTAALVLTLVERGQVALDEPVRTVLPELQRPETEQITLRHLLTHTSGLAGYLTENEALRAAQQPLERFVDLSLQANPRFAPGTQFCYSNIGVALLSEIAARLYRQPYAAALREHVLQPWGLPDIVLPLPEDQWPRAALVADADYGGTDHETFNSAYFRGLGIPWGGAYATAPAVAAFAQPFLNAWQGREDSTPLSPASRRLATTAQMSVPPAAPDRHDDVNAQVWPAIGWGLGWDVKVARHRHFTGDLTSPATFGHTGASGTAVWADPETGILVVLLANRALRSAWAARPPRQARFANAVVAAVASQPSQFLLRRQTGAP